MTTQKISLQGEYKLTVLNADRSIKYETDWFPNLITNIGLDQIGAAAPVGTYMRIGTGNTAPANSDTQLVAQAASTFTTVAGGSTVNAGAPNYETQNTTNYEFALGAVVGNMAEIGVGWDASAPSTLFSRALILDGFGAPTTITVLVTEILQATYRLTSFPDLSDSTGTVVIGGDTYGYTARVADCVTASGVSVANVMLDTVYGGGTYDGGIGAITGLPSGTNTGLEGGSFSPYTPASYFRDFSMTAGLTVGNAAGGILSITVRPGGGSGVFLRTQMEFSPVIPKDNTKVMSLVFRQAWARH